MRELIFKVNIEGDSNDLNEDERVISTIMLDHDFYFELKFVRVIMKCMNFRRFVLFINPNTLSDEV